MRLIWTTDPHLNHVSSDVRDQWIRDIAEQHGDGVILTGDISEGADVIEQLQWIGNALGVPIHFVLGNHDFSRGSIAGVRQQVVYATHDSFSLHYLTDLAATPLGEGTYLVGEDGWGDATEGDYEHSPIRLNDFLLIRDFHDTSPGHWKQQLIALGAESAARLKHRLESLPADARHVLVATHVPPFCQACWYEGRTTDEYWAPFFVCGQVGRVLLDYCDQRSDVKVTVLCGHTHHRGIATMRDNLVVYTGAADYGAPGIEAVVHCEAGGIDVAAIAEE